MSFVLPPLPYPEQALEPYISRQTLLAHHGRHHAAYIARTNDLITGTVWQDRSLEEVIIGAHETADTGLFNAAAQAWNHEFYWQSLTPHGGGMPKGAMATLVERDFTSRENLEQKLVNAALAQFGSGWVWLVLVGGHLQIVTTSNADTPLVHGHQPLLVLDVWEHAYYLDHQHRRGDYILHCVRSLLNWDFANLNLSQDRKNSATAAVLAQGKPDRVSATHATRMSTEMSTTTSRH